jgi:predicted amidohydrolase
MKTYFVLLFLCFSPSFQVSVIQFSLFNFLPQQNNQISIQTQRSTIEDEDYVMGVVEFTPELPTVNWQLRTVLHFENYTRIIREAAEQDVDILIFPEYTLNNVAFPIEIPDLLDEVNPCEDPAWFDNLLIDLSCLARENEIYLCINLNEREDCTEESQEARNDTRPCSSLGFSRYNTNVIFDRNGTVVGRYRKFNLFREGGINTTLIPELSTFETDFGVTFGNIICFDVLFFEPAMQLVKMGVKNFIFPGMWTSELPFLTCEFRSL